MVHLLVNDNPIEAPVCWEETTVKVYQDIFRQYESGDDAIKLFNVITGTHYSRVYEETSEDLDAAIYQVTAFVNNQPMEFKKRPFQTGIVGGGLLFGVGWYFTAACPGPIYALIGTGTWTALVILAGALARTLLYGWLKPKLPH